MSAVINSLSNKMEISFNAVASMLKMSGGTAGEWEKIFLSDIQNENNVGQKLHKRTAFH